MTAASEAKMGKPGPIQPRVHQRDAIVPPVAASQYLAAAATDWQPTSAKGFWIKPLYENAAVGERTLLMKVDPGAFAGSHAHEDFEQFYVLEGSLYDDEHELHAGDYCCRAPGTFHSAGSRDGCVVLLIYTDAPRLLARA